MMARTSTNGSWCEQMLKHLPVKQILRTRQRRPNARKCRENWTRYWVWRCHNLRRTKRHRRDKLDRASGCSSPFHCYAELPRLGGLPLLAQKLVSAKRHRGVVGYYPLDTVLLHKSTELREPRKSFTFIRVDGINVSSTCLVAHVTAIVTVNVSSSRCQDGSFPPRSYGVSDDRNGSEGKSLLAKVLGWAASLVATLDSLTLV